jgi:hypothetical protein
VIGEETRVGRDEKKLEEGLGSEEFSREVPIISLSINIFGFRGTIWYVWVE